MCIVGLEGHYSYYELLPLGKFINSDLYCHPLLRFKQKVDKKQPKMMLINSQRVRASVRRRELRAYRRTGSSFSLLACYTDRFGLIIRTPGIPGRECSWATVTTHSDGSHARFPLKNGTLKTNPEIVENSLRIQLLAAFNLRYPSTAPGLQSTIVHSIRVGISEMKLYASIDTWCSEILFGRPKLARRRSCE
ncbi:hypothetical protein EVAR_6061_1 [Eumeta japonica]|uniref:Uncharacterized protein n=1 Tax=Eumeta variegata TaxID=151549 RepID=A0A4C1T9Y1_EUMVA|nr:hypothetical protein EVAR_6061_1 [Eumeta japonica]